MIAYCNEFPYKGSRPRGKPATTTKDQPPAPHRGVPFEDPFATFWEWDTPEDDEAFKDLRSMDIVSSAVGPVAPWDIVRSPAGDR